MSALRDSRRRWWLLVLLITGLIFCYAHRGALSVAAPFMIREGRLSPAAMGLLLSAFFWTYSFMQVPAGWLVDRAGVRRAYALGFTLWSLASVLTGFAAHFVSLALVRMLMGLGQSVAFPASARAVADGFRDGERGGVTAAYLTGVRIGQALIAGVGGFFLARHGWQDFFLFTGVVPLVWLLPWLLFRGLDAPAPYRLAGQSRHPFATVGLLRQRTVLGIFLGFFAYDYAWFLFINWLPSYLVLERHFSAQEMALYSSIPYLVMSVVILLAGVGSDALVRRGFREVTVRKALCSAGLAVACFLVPAGMVEDHGTAVWLLGVSLGGLGITAPNAWALTQAACPKPLVGTVSGIQNFGGNLGGALAPALTGFIASYTGSFMLALSLTGAILIGGILAYCFLVSKPVQEAGNPHAKVGS